MPFELVLFIISVALAFLVGGYYIGMAAAYRIYRKHFKSS